MDPLALNGAIAGLSAISCLAICAWTLVAVTRARHAKALASGPSSESLKPLEQRLERIERATEAIAMEVERIAEGQRFVTKLLSEPEHANARIGAPRT
ncbi:MAG: hypothetical protein ABI035_01025 [Gemmatimonadaceae bacterium]